ncbi:MAG: NYN domain-containing protein [Candidatus Uhrbacteria bacterium]|nr:NYN domain-containing protein [Candidatus Uhrbacteria bacterium]
MIEKNNFAFIDGQNLYLSIRELGWSLDYKRFRVYLAEKYHIGKAYLFIGFMEENRDLYKSLQEKGYILIFKPTLKYQDGHTKGNCDAELVLQSMIDFDEYNKAMIVTGDGDFYCLVSYLIKQKKLEKLLIPNQGDYSALLKRFPSEYLAFVSDLKTKLEYKKKRTP